MTDTAGQAHGGIDELIEALDALDDGPARDCARRLVQALLDLHGAGLSRILDIVAERAVPGPAMLEALARDEAVSALLLLHGLHPHDLVTRVGQAVDGLRRTLGLQGIGIEVSAVAEDGVRLRLRGMWQGKPLTPTRLRRDIEDAIFALAPEVAAVEIDNLPDAEVHELKFVPVSTFRAHDMRSGG